MTNHPDVPKVVDRFASLHPDSADGHSGVVRDAEGLVIVEVAEEGVQLDEGS